jgi:hypothetical protein
VLLAGVLEHDGELVAAEPPERRGRSQHAQQARRDPRQHPVAERMAERVVDALEVVEVGDHHDRARPGALGGRDRAAQAIEEQPPVREARELVV